MSRRQRIPAQAEASACSHDAGRRLERAHEVSSEEPRTMRAPQSARTRGHGARFYERLSHVSVERFQAGRDLRRRALAGPGVGRDDPRDRSGHRPDDRLGALGRRGRDARRDRGRACRLPGLGRQDRAGARGAAAQARRRDHDAPGCAGRAPDPRAGQAPGRGEGRGRHERGLCALVRGGSPARLR